MVVQCRGIFNEDMQMNSESSHWHVSSNWSVAALVAVMLTTSLRAQDIRVNFERDIRPLLSLKTMNLFARREIFQHCLSGMGTVALGSLLANDGNAKPLGIESPLAPKRTHFAPQARNIIFLKMAGGPSLDLFDYKPVLQQRNGEPCPEQLVENQQFAFIVGRAKMLGSPFSFARYGESGAEVSELLPHIARIVDKLCMIKSMKTDQFNHTPALLLLQIGSTIPGLPCMGAWRRKVGIYPHLSS